MVQQYRKQLSNKSRLQSSLGGQKPVGNVKANQLIMAKVMKVNYLYNTVEVITIHNREMLVKQDDTRGQFSARMPVVFGGSYANGQSYGQTIPINVGDQVLIGFMEEDKNAPVVIGVYKDASVAYELAPTNQVSGNPDTDTNTRKRVMEHLQLFPSQTYNWVDGEGGREATFQGRSFLKSAVGLYGSSRLNDYGYNYENLERIHLRGRDIEPVEPELPQIMFQHNATFASSATSVLFDDDSTFSLSKVSNNKTILNRSELRLNSPNSIAIRNQENSRKYDDSSNSAEIGITDLVLHLKTPKYTLTLDDDNGLLLNGKPIQDSGALEEVEKIQKQLDELGDTLKDLSKIVSGEDSGKIKDLLEDVESLQKELETLDTNIADAKQVLSEYDERLKHDEDSIKLNDEAIGKLNQQWSNASGANYETLDDRLNDIEAKAKSADIIAKEVVAAHVDNNDKHTYSTIGSRLDTLSKLLTDTKDSVSDIATIRENSSLVPNMNNELGHLTSIVNEITGENGKIPDTTYEVIPYTDTSLIEEGSKKRATVQARILRNGMDVTNNFGNNDVVWQRISNDTSGDSAWNKNHLDGRLQLNIGESDVSTSSRFRATLTPRLTGGSKLVYNEVSILFEPLTQVSLYITSLQGFLLTPNTPSTQLFAKLYRRGKEIDEDGKTYTYTWTAYDEHGSQINGFKKTGKAIVVSPGDISGQANTYQVEVS